MVNKLNQIQMQPKFNVENYKHNGTLNTMPKQKLHFGSKRPIEHGLVRKLVQLKLDVRLAVDPHIKKLHRGTEKLLESLTSQYSQ